jgi:hypothetical protein
LKTGLRGRAFVLMKKIKNKVRNRNSKITIIFFFGIVLYISVSFLFRFFPFAGTEKYPKPKNIILIVVDALRADRLGFMGYGRNTSPALDSYAQQGIIFTNFYSQSGWTMPSVASFFTGMLPAFHRVENYQDVLSDDEMTLAKMLKSRGYKTVGLCANSIISKEAGFAQGFDLWKNIDFDDCIVRRAVSYLDPSMPTPITAVSGICALRNTARMESSRGTSIGEDMGSNMKISSRIQKFDWRKAQVKSNPAYIASASA